MIDVSKVALFIPPGLKKFKLNLFERIGQHIINLGGATVRHDYAEINKLPDDIIPIVGCTPQFRDYISDWRSRGRKFIYWDRGYLRRVFATWLPDGHSLGIPGGYYRWHVNSFQMQNIDDVPSDRFKFLKLDNSCEKGNQISPWNKNGDYIIVADTLPDYWKLFCDEGWTKRTVDILKQYTKRPIRIREKESKLDLRVELKNAHCLVAHGSIAAVEAVVMGCPVFVDPMSAASLVGQIDLSKIEAPVYPERDRWLHSLAYCQFNETELCDGTLWRLIR